MSFNILDDCMIFFFIGFVFLIVVIVIVLVITLNGIYSKHKHFNLRVVPRFLSLINRGLIRLSEKPTYPFDYAVPFIMKGTFVAKKIIWNFLESIKHKMIWKSDSLQWGISFNVHRWFLFIFLLMYMDDCYSFFMISRFQLI